jgi:hypothetical protein
VQSGNSFGVNATLGTNDNFALNFETFNTPRMTITNDGNVGIGTTSPSSKIEVIPGTSQVGLFVNAPAGTQEAVRIRGGSGVSVAPSEVSIPTAQAVKSFFTCGSGRVASPGVNGTIGGKSKLEGLISCPGALASQGVYCTTTPPQADSCVWLAWVSSNRNRSEL